MFQSQRQHCPCGTILTRNLKMSAFNKLYLNFPNKIVTKIGNMSFKEGFGRLTTLQSWCHPTKPLNKRKKKEKEP